MAQTVIFALLAFILSLTYVPMMSSLFLSKKFRKKEEFFGQNDGKSRISLSLFIQQSFKIPNLIFFSVVGLFSSH
jgi:cobalt-zinc-cadmium resistance protein CzcA